MDTDKWVVAARVGESAPAMRTDSSGDMEQLELMEFIGLSEHDTKQDADRAAEIWNARDDGWVYTVLSQREYDAATQTAGSDETILPKASRELA